MKYFDFKETDPFMLAALYRAYTFVASGFLLSPAHHSRDSNGTYGRAHERLSDNIAQPLCHVADALQVYPFLDYHYAYSLGNSNYMIINNHKNNTIIHISRKMIRGTMIYKMSY